MYYTLCKCIVCMRATVFLAPRFLCFIFKNITSFRNNVQNKFSLQFVKQNRQANLPSWKVNITSFRKINSLFNRQAKSSSIVKQNQTNRPCWCAVWSSYHQFQTNRLDRHQTKTNHPPLWLSTRKIWTNVESGSPGVDP